MVEYFVLAVAFAEIMLVCGLLATLLADSPAARWLLLIYGAKSAAHHMNFRHLPSIAPAGSSDIILADLGLCSSQIDDLVRGFSFRTHSKGAHAISDADAPLDMRFDQSPTSSCIPVSDWLRRTKPSDVANALMKFGEVRADLCCG